MSIPRPRSSRAVMACAVAAVLLVTLRQPVCADPTPSSTSNKPATAAVKLAPPPIKPPVATSTPSASSQPADTPSAAAIPDYGGRDAVLTPPTGDVPGLTNTSPLAAAWRAFESLVVVLALIVIALIVIRRYGLLKNGLPFQIPGGAKPGRNAPRPAQKPSGPMGTLTSAWKAFLTPSQMFPSAESPLQVVASTPLPGPAGGSVHLIEVEGRRFLVGAATGGLTLLAEWENEAQETEAATVPEEEVRFESYLNRMGMTAQSPPEVVGERVSQAADRLQAMLARTQQEGAE